MANSVASEVRNIFRAVSYPLEVMDDRLLGERGKAEKVCKDSGLDWSRARPEYVPRSGLRNEPEVVVLWRVRG